MIRALIVSLLCLLQGLVEQDLVTNGIPAAMWFYNTQTPAFAGTTYNFAPVNGVDDPRITQMLSYAR